MDITLEQAKAFDAVHRLGTFQKAASELNKGHSAVLYLIKSLEEQTGLKLFDRSGYRNQMTKDGEVVLKFCQKLLLTQADLKQMCQKLKTGWEPSLTLIYDGVIDFNFIGDTLFKLNSQQVPTEVNVLSAHLDEVIARFESGHADMIATILPVEMANISAISLRPIKMLLVAHKDHLLGASKKTLSIDDLNRHTFIKITNAAVPLGLSTEKMKFSSSFFVNDFSTKKLALLKKLGYGWMPEYLIEKELHSKTLKVLKTEIENEHVFKPKLYHRKTEFLGKTAQTLLKYFSSKN